MTKFEQYTQPAEHVMGRPQDIDAEQFLLGSVMNRPDLYDEVSQIVHPRDFLEEWHAWTWHELTSLVNQDATIDRDSIVRALTREMQEHDPLKIQAFIDGLMYTSFTPSNARYYAGLVAADAVRRRLCDVAPMVSVVANDRHLSIEQVRDRVASLISGAMDTMENETQSAHASELATDVIDEILADAAANRKRCGASTGISILDAALSGLSEGEVIVIAARTSVGKSALALRITESFCKRGEKVVYFSLEMSKKSLMERFVSMMTRVPAGNIRNRALTQDQKNSIYDAKNSIGNWDLQIDEKPGVTPQYVRSKCRIYARKTPISLIVADHIHIMDATVKTGDEVKDLGAITRDLHNLARDLRVPILALCQLNRGPENRTDPVPTIRDIRGSGSIEENADSILAIHRPELRKSKDASEEPVEIEEAQLHILKNRNGPAGSYVKIVFKADCVRFDNSAEEAQGRYYVPTAPAPPTTAQPSLVADVVDSTAPLVDPFADLAEEAASNGVNEFFGGLIR